MRQRFTRRGQRLDYLYFWGTPIRAKSLVDTAQESADQVHGFRRKFCFFGKLQVSFPVYNLLDQQPRKVKSYGRLQKET